MNFEFRIMKTLEKIELIKQKAVKVNIITSIVCFDCEQVFDCSNKQDKCIGCGELYNPELEGEVCPYCGSDEYDTLCPKCLNNNIDYLDNIIGEWNDYEYLMVSPKMLLNKINKYLDNKLLTDNIKSNNF